MKEYQAVTIENATQAIEAGNMLQDLLPISCRATAIRQGTPYYVVVVRHRELRHLPKGAVETARTFAKAYQLARKHVRAVEVS